MGEAQRNLELKVRAADLDALLDRTLALGARDEGASRDIDTYFAAPSGRLKLRQTEGVSGGTLVAYRRADEPGSRYSHYRLVEVADAPALLAALTETLGVRVVVVKQRHVLIYGATRIHLDRVDGLGSFVELETVLAGQAEAEATAEHELVKRALGLEDAEPVVSSYGDLAART
ncbi:MAG TPA: class IV adenylate cyclase [Thermomicrobiaceae bacterium]|nr:class IV adenylate cyclase [Thermomicrobiaceae bacterium]